MSITVSKLQIALGADASGVQSTLTNLSLEADTQTQPGLWQLLQGVVRSIVESAQFWTHAGASSRTFDSPNEAQTFFDLLSTEERSKFSAETLTNIDGCIAQTLPPLVEDRGTPAYIVVTLLLGIAGDWRGWDGVGDESALSHSGLKRILETLTRMPPEDLMVLELLWSPQTAADSLSAEEMEAEYRDLKPLV